MMVKKIIVVLQANLRKKMESDPGFRKRADFKIALELAHNYMLVGLIQESTGYEYAHNGAITSQFNADAPFGDKDFREIVSFFKEAGRVQISLSLNTAGAIYLELQFFKKGRGEWFYMTGSAVYA